MEAVLINLWPGKMGTFFLLPRSLAATREAHNFEAWRAGDLVIQCICTVGGWMNGMAFVAVSYLVRKELVFSVVATLNKEPSQWRMT